MHVHQRAHGAAREHNEEGRERERGRIAQASSGRLRDGHSRENAHGEPSRMRSIGNLEDAGERGDTAEDKPGEEGLHGPLVDNIPEVHASARGHPAEAEEPVDDAAETNSATEEGVLKGGRPNRRQDNQRGHLTCASSRLDGPTEHEQPVNVEHEVDCADMRKRGGEQAPRLRAHRRGRHHQGVDLRARFGEQGCSDGREGKARGDRTAEQC